MSAEPSSIPGWLQPLATAARHVQARDLTRFVPPAGNLARPASVLVLLGGDDSPDESRHVLLLERAHDLRSHAGQIAFPGGAHDLGDTDAVATALREAEEETGLDPAGVEVVATLPKLWLPPSNFEVTPVVAWWRTPSPVRAVDPAETASVHIVALAELLDPVNRVTMRHPSGYRGPAFLVADLVVWGFTAGLLSRLFSLVGWERPWDAAKVVHLSPELLALASDPRRERVEP
jgi:8-oxo-dGTP pyrophosphatase MutT (NUDIX family)